ncbi:PqqD family peptide modification chaperone [Rhodovulum strictum]|uniref:PqqD family peptide modification chaperone n=1 Tax=Rhodovulum strictum TaxID=58314 RepID=UPI0014790E68
MDRKTGAGSAGPISQARLLHFAGTDLVVRLDNAPGVQRALAQAVRGWPMGGPVRPEARETRVTGTRSGYATRSVYLDEPIEGLGLAGAACAVIADLAQDYFETRPGCLALHCAAFRFNGRLIAMTGPSRAGKSTLAARLTQEPDCELFCDDVLPMPQDGLAVALGIAPRLRLPLPETASAAFRAHVARHLGPRDDRYGYLCAPTVAPHGTSAPLGILLVLDRRAGAPARLHDVAEDEALHLLLSQNMSDLQTAEAAFARLSGLLAAITCLRLVYSDLEEAIALIRRAFGGAAPVAEGVGIGPALPAALPDRLAQADLSPDICWARDGDVVIQHRQDSAFLWQPGKPMIWHMNRLGQAVWTLLEIPGSAREIGALLHEHFPDKDASDLVSDVNALLHALAQDGLIERKG